MRINLQQLVAKAWIPALLIMAVIFPLEVYKSYKKTKGL